MGELKIYTIEDITDILKTDAQAVIDEIKKGNIEAFNEKELPVLLAQGTLTGNNFTKLNNRKRV